MTHLLVTNDFPPKIGGIQTSLWELWRRLEPSSFAVLTTSSHPAATAFDAEQARAGFRIERLPGKVLLPTPATLGRVRSLADDIDASLVVFDPVLPAGLIGPALGDVPYAVVLHGAEVAVPGRLPAGQGALAAVLGHARLAICAGPYPAAEGSRAARGRMPQVAEVPPGVDGVRFHPLTASARRAARASFGLPVGGPVVVSVSRLVPRKGMDVLIEATAALVPSFPELSVVIAGDGRHRRRLASLAKATAAPVRLVGAVSDDALPTLYGAADIFAMACHDRWFGLEQEGFGMVFLEAAACGVPQVAGRSGGAGDAVVHGETGVLVDNPRDPGRVAAAVRRLRGDDALRRRMGRAARRRAQTGFAWDVLAHRLASALKDVGG